MNTFAVLAVLVPAVSALTVNTPMAPVVCQPVQITWSSEGSSPPYYLSLIPGLTFLVTIFTLSTTLTNSQSAGQPSASALKQFPMQQGTSFVWERVTLPVGTGFTVSLKDSNGQQVYSAPTTVQDGGDSSCVNRDVKEASTSGSATNSTSMSSVVNNGTSSSPAAATAGTPTSSNSAPPVSHKSDTAKSSSSASPSHSVKANSVARDISSGAIAGIMFAVGLTSVVVALVV